MGAAGLGLGPDSAKMAGSSANMAAAQRQALQPSETDRLQDVLRTRTLAREETTPEGIARQKAASVSGLSSLQERVQQLVLAQMSQVTPPTTAAYTPDSSKITTLYPNITGTVKNKLVEILTRHGAGKANSAEFSSDFSDAATILGITDITQVGPKLTELLKTTGAEIGGAGAAAIGDKLFITREALIQMGTSASELAGILGKEEDDILKLTTDELVGQINNLAAKEYSRAEALRQIISDPNVGAAERQAAQEQLIGLGYAGVSAVESDMGRLNAELENANSVTINGETLSVSEILADSFLSSLIKDYLDNSTGDAAEYINSTPGLSGFKAFIDANRTALAATTVEMAADVTAFAGIQTATAALKTNPKTGTGLSDQTAADMGIGVKGFVDAVPVAPPVVAYINDGKDADGTITTSLNNIAAIDGAADTGGIMAGIKVATQDELQASGFIDNADDYANYVTKISALNNSSPQSQEQVLESIFGDNFDIPGLEAELTKIRNFQKSGLITTVDPVMDLLDADRDGKLDSPDKLKAAFLGKISKDGRPMTIQEILAGGPGVTVATLNKTIKDMIDGKKNITSQLAGEIVNGKPSSPNANLIRTYGSIFEDGTIDSEELEVLKNAPIADMEKLIGLNVTGSASLSDILKNKALQEANDIRASAEVNITDAEMDAKFDNPYVGLNTMMDVSEKLKTYIQSGKFNDLSKSTQAQMYTIYDKIINRAEEEYNKFIEQTMRRQLDTEISKPRTRLDKEISALENQLSKPTVNSMGVDNRPALMRLLAEAKEQLRQLDINSPAITERIRTETKARNPATRITSSKGWRK